MFRDWEFADIKRWVESAGAATDEVEELLGDSREAVRQLGETVLQQYEHICREEERVRNLYRRERELHDKGYQLIAGVDEAGRGPLAGPVVAAAVVFPPGVMLPGIRDSKTLTPARRELLYDLICRKALATAVGVVSNETIDECNILQATMLAMRRAVESLPVVPDFCLVDGNHLPELPCPGEAVVDADATCFAVACAGIVAKVYRDRLMVELDRRYPGYGLASHKGYPTAAHMEAIRQLGPSPIHRVSFKGVREVAEQSALPGGKQDSSV